MSRDVTDAGQIFTNALREIVMAEPDASEDGTPYWPSFAGKLQNIAAAALTQSAPESVLLEAARLVDGDRQTAYGHPKDNHACTAALWNAYINRRCAAKGERLLANFPPATLDAFDVCMLNILQKVSRLAHTRHRDGLVDVAGFARNAEMVDE